MSGSLDPQALVPRVPLTFGQMLDRTFRVMRANWRPLFGVSFFFCLVLVAIFAIWIVAFFALLGLPLDGHITPPTSLFLKAFGVFYVVLMVSQFFLLTLYFPAGCLAALQANRGQAVQVRSVCARVWKSFRTHLWTHFLLVVRVAGPSLVVFCSTALMILVGASLAPHQAALGLLIPLGMLLYFASLVYAVFAVLRLCFTFLVSVDEGLTGKAALLRSAQLTQGARGRIFGLLFVVYLLMYAVSYIALMVVSMFLVGGILVVSTAHVVPGSPAFYVLIALAVAIGVPMFAAYFALHYASIFSALATLYDEQRGWTGSHTQTPQSVGGQV